MLQEENLFALDQKGWTGERGKAARKRWRNVKIKLWLKGLN